MSRACVVFAAASLSLAGWSYAPAQALRADSDRAQNATTDSAPQRGGAADSNPQGSDRARASSKPSSETGNAQALPETNGAKPRADEAATGGPSGGKVDPQRVHAVGGAKISQNDAAQIATSLLATSQPRNVNAAVKVGAPVPGDVNLLPLPPNVVGIVPEYRGYDYVVANDDLAIVQPSTRQVVEVISESGETAMNKATTQTVAGAPRVNPCGP